MGVDKTQVSKNGNSNLIKEYFLFWNIINDLLQTRGPHQRRSRTTQMSTKNG